MDPKRALGNRVHPDVNLDFETPGDVEWDRMEQVFAWNKRLNMAKVMGVTALAGTVVATNEQGEYDQAALVLTFTLQDGTYMALQVPVAEVDLLATIEQPLGIGQLKKCARCHEPEGVGEHWRHRGDVWEHRCRASKLLGWYLAEYEGEP